MIVVDHISKEYRIRKDKKRNIFVPHYTTIKAVDDISFSIGPGEILGYIGPNGAGKSTTIKILTGILTPTAGSVNINGLNPHKQREKCMRDLGAMFGQKTQLWWDLPLKDSFQIIKSMYNISDQVYKDNMELFCQVLEIHDFYDSTVRQLSLGQRVRGDLAAVFLHNPSVVLLDEPTIGIDIVAKKKIRDFIREINMRKKTTLLLTSHDISDIEALCDRVLLINGGKLAYDGSLEKLRAQYGSQRTLSITFSEDYPDFSLSNAALCQSKPYQKSFVFDRLVSPSKIIEEILRNHQVKDIALIEPSIEDIIRDLYQSTRIGK